MNYKYIVCKCNNCNNEHIYHVINSKDDLKIKLAESGYSIEETKCDVCGHEYVEIKTNKCKLSTYAELISEELENRNQHKLARYPISLLHTLDEIKSLGPGSKRKILKDFHTYVNIYV